MKHIHHILYCLLIIAGLSSCITAEYIKSPVDVFNAVVYMEEPNELPAIV